MIDHDIHRRAFLRRHENEIARVERIFKAKGAFRRAWARCYKGVLGYMTRWGIIECTWCWRWRGRACGEDVVIENLGGYFSKCQNTINKGTKSMQSIKAQKAAKVSKYLLGFDILSGQTLQGSFSAVSKPIFATKYSLESSRRDLHNALLCTVLLLSLVKICQFCYQDRARDLEGELLPLVEDLLPRALADEALPRVRHLLVHLPLRLRARVRGPRDLRRESLELA